MKRYSVVLFKDKSLKKIIKNFVTLQKAQEFFNKQIEKSNSVIFDVMYENGKPCKYEISLLDHSPSDYELVYLTDEFGRNIKIKLDDNKSSIIKISLFKKEEKIFDLNKNKKIEMSFFLKTYLNKDSLKLVSTLNNKIIVQNDDKTYLFSLKNSEETHRFVDCLMKYFRDNKRADCIFVKDSSTAQKKYLFKLLSEKGFDKKTLYRKATTHPRLK